MAAMPSQGSREERVALREAMRLSSSVAHAGTQCGRIACGVEDGLDDGPTVLQAIKEGVGKATDHHPTKPGLLDEPVGFRLIGDVIQSSFDGALERVTSNRTVAFVPAYSGEVFGSGSSGEVRTLAHSLSRSICLTCSQV